MTVENPQRCSIPGIVRKICFEAIALGPYPDGTYKTGPLIGQLKYSQGGGSQTNYRVKPYRDVRADDPLIDIPEALRWSLIGIEAREKDVNKALKVQIRQAPFDMTVCCYYQKGNVRRLLLGDAPNKPTGPTFLEEVCGYFNEGKDQPPEIAALCEVKAIAAFMLFNTNANNKQTLGHTYRRGSEIQGCSGNFGNQLTYPFFPTGILLKENRQERPVQELFDTLHKLDPTRAMHV